MSKRIHLMTDLDYVFKPAVEKPSGKIMIVLHGKGDSIQPFLEFQEETKLYEVDFLLLNAPKGYLDGFSWYGEPPFMKKNVERSRIYINQILQQLLEQGYLAKDVYILGYSQGCLLSFDVLLRSGFALGGVIGISGYFQFPERWRKRLSRAVTNTPLLFTHGRRDKVLPIDETYYGVKKLARAGFPVQWFELKKNHEFIDDDYPLIRNFVMSQK